MPMVSHPCGALSGVAQAPGDKSISHRALILGALSVGETRIRGLLEAEDVHHTAAAMRALGASARAHSGGEWSVHGVGVGGFAEPDRVIDCGNAGTGVRLVMGAMATTDITATFTGDASLNRRPMARVLDPLALFGARAVGRAGGRLPLTLVGAANPVPARYVLPVASAQVKSALLLAGLNAPGQTVVIEPTPTRDHTERMLQGFGAHLTTAHTAQGTEITLRGQPELQAQNLAVPGDFSSAAFALCAAIITPGSALRLPGVGVNPTRTGLLETLQAMGAQVVVSNKREEGGEPVADLQARFSPDLRGVEVPAERAARMIDEYPVLSVVAAFARGRTRMEGVGELRVKESDRIAAMAQGLEANGVRVEQGADWWAVQGAGPGGVAGGARCATCLDHRIAMSFLVMGMAAQSAIAIDDGGPIATSFPDFSAMMEALGARIEPRP